MKKRKMRKGEGLSLWMDETKRKIMNKSLYLFTPSVRLLLQRACVALGQRGGGVRGCVREPQVCRSGDPQATFPDGASGAGGQAREKLPWWVEGSGEVTEGLKWSGKH